MARPTLFRPEFIEQARRLCEILGATDFEVAQFFGIAKRTLYDWQLAHPELKAAMQAGKDVADDRVERSLYERATGYSFEAEEIFLVEHTEELAGDTPEAAKRLVHTKKPLRVETVKHVAPDTTAGIFWLKNRRPGLWRDIKAVAVSGDGNGGPVKLVSKIERVIVRANAANPDG